ncbi:unnamed protein product [Gongylonema pulchrum]|uniref:Uncharacterized protein n=1 Tax=Gongylonema pulchrum TaxID=637853 RepID=A0A3P6Q9G6_9BILA|nr:unnamed protein product [Gongylonema pulchrum]
MARRCADKIVHLQGKNLSTEDWNFLQTWNNYSQENQYWKPQQALAFQKASFLCSESESKQADSVVLSRNESCAYFFAKSTDSSHLAVAVEKLQRDGSGGFVLPKALLCNPAIAVKAYTFPAKILDDKFDLFTGNADANKELFEKVFEWKKEDRIKGAIIMSQKIIDSSAIDEDPGFTNAQKMSSLLGSLPEAPNMTVCAVTDYSNYPHSSMKRNESKIALLLFGGDAVHANAFSCPDHTPTEDFQKWKAQLDSLCKISQTIGFYISSMDCPPAYECCK